MDSENKNREPFEGKDVRLERVTEDSMEQCVKCKFSKGDATACGKYKMKPGAVILGEGQCSYFEE